MEKHEVTKWLIVMKASLNSFPEVSSAKKIEALEEAIRFLKNEGSEEPSKSVEEKCSCYDCEYFVIDGLSHCKIYEGAYGDCRCKNYHKVNQDLTKVKQDLTKVNQGSNKSEIPTGSIVKNDLGVREFEEIVVEYLPEDLCTYPEYKGKPYFSIKYKEGNDCFIGYGTYKPKVFSRYLRDYFMPSVTPQEPRWIPVSERLPTKEEYIANNGLFIVTDGNRTYAEYFDVYNSMKYFGEPTMNGFRVDRCVSAWMPLPLPWKGE